MRDYESMWQKLYGSIESKARHLENLIHDESDSAKLRIMASRYFQLLEIQREMDRMEKCEHLVTEFGCCVGCGESKSGHPRRLRHRGKC